jgi:polysaccharide export outer membrane protein
LEGIMNLSTLALAVLLVTSAQATVGQPVTATSPAAPAPQTNPGGPSPATYRIGLEDEIRLVVDGEDQFNNVFRVQSDGGVALPYLGTVTAQGLTTRELEDRIRRLLIDKDLLRNPQVRAEVSKFGSQFVMVQGEVRVPQRLQMTGPMTLMEALAAAGSTTANASVVATVARTLVSAPGEPPRDPLKYTIDLRDLYNGVAAANISLMNGDIINVPKTEVFYVQGRVKNVGVQNWEPGLTIDQAITRAGGVDDRGKRTGVKVNRLVDGKSRTIDVKPTDLVQPNDNIIVPSRLF